MLPVQGRIVGMTSSRATNAYHHSVPVFSEPAVPIAQQRVSVKSALGEVLKLCSRMIDRWVIFVATGGQ